MRFASMLFFSLSAVFISTASFANEIQITGSVQFWVRQCALTYVCELPQAVSPRLEIASLITEPTPAQRLSTASINFAYESYAGKLSVFWNLNGGDPYLAGQSFLSKDGVRIAECSHFAKADVKTFIPTGFCSGYTTAEENIQQFGMTFYK